MSSVTRELLRVLPYYKPWTPSKEDIERDQREQERLSRMTSQQIQAELLRQTDEVLKMIESQEKAELLRQTNEILREIESQEKQGKTEGTAK